MMRRWAIVLLHAVSAAAFGQSTAAMYGDLQSSMAAAAAAATRPGDEALGCEALQSELVATAKDPAVQVFVAKSGAIAQDKMAAMSAAGAGMGAQAAMTIMSSLGPGGAWAGYGANVAQAQAAQGMAARNMEQQMQQAPEMMTIMPQMMRGQKVIGLAQRRNCEWLQEAMSAK
jgi:hypothetical protein